MRQLPPDECGLLGIKLDGQTLAKFCEGVCPFFPVASSHKEPEPKLPSNTLNRKISEQGTRFVHSTYNIITEVWVTHSLLQDVISKFQHRRTGERTKPKPTHAVSCSMLQVDGA
jgi:hypothetical protein